MLTKIDEEDYFSQEMRKLSFDLGLSEVIWDIPVELHIDNFKMSLEFPLTGINYQLDWKKDYQQLLKEKLSVRQEMLGRAIYPQNKKACDKKKWPVIDATCGTGKDTLFLLALGFRVIAFESNPLLYLFLKHQEKILKENYIDLPLEIYCGDFKDYSEKMNQANCLYFDPMYDQGKISTVKDRKAKPRKEIIAIGDIFDNQYFKKLLTDPKDDLQFICSQHFSRVVVKRSLKGSEILPGVNSSFKGKSTRFDLYIGTKKFSTEV